VGTSDGEANAAESGYFAARGLLAKSVAEAARFIAERGVLAEGAPALVRFIAQIASRFGVVVTQKLAAQAVPVIGALGGAAVSYAFIDHFQEVAPALRRAPARTALRQDCCPSHIRAVLLRDRSGPSEALGSPISWVAIHAVAQKPQLDLRNHVHEEPRTYVRLTEVSPRLGAKR
jgi:hypothetical protein